MKIISVLWITLFASCVHAIDYYCPPKEKLEQYAAQISVSYELEGSSYSVQIEAPTKIDGMPFGYLMVSKGDNGGVFAMPLKSVLEDNKIEAWFFANESTLSGAVLYASYGNHCPATISKQLKHNK